MQCPEWRLLLVIHAVLAVAVVAVWITRDPVVVAYLATLLTAVSVVIKVLRSGGDRGA